MINWPESLVTEVAHRRCIFFLGAGVSANSKCAEGLKSPPTWEQFIRKTAELVPHDEQSQINELIDDKQYLIALQAISDLADNGDYIELINQEFHQPNYQPTELHKVIHELDSRIVITTNFDTIYEKYCASEGYKSLLYSSKGLIDEIRSDRRLIIKAHGSIDDIDSLVFTRKEYRTVKSEHPQFYEVLKALLITNTCIFIGCGMCDPDVTLILEELQGAHANTKNHYTLIREGDYSKFIKADWKASYSIKALEYTRTEDHSELLTSLKDLLGRVNEHRSTQTF